MSAKNSQHDKKIKRRFARSAFGLPRSAIDNEKLNQNNFWWFSTNVTKEEERNWKNSKEGAREETTKMDVPFVSLQRL